MTHSLRLLRGAGYRVYAADRNPQSPGFAFADGHAPIDIAEVGAIRDYARRINADLILAVNEAGVLTAAAASEELRLPGLPPHVALQSLDKGLMRDCWRRAALSQPAYRVAQSVAEIEAAAAALGYPVVLKPARNWGSRGVSVVNDPAALPWAVEFARSQCRNGRFLVEEFIPGLEMTVEGLVQHGRPQVLARSDKLVQAHPRYRVDMVLHYPAKIPPRQAEQVDEVVQRAALALGIENGAFHCECMVNERGVYLIEMGARGGGGHIFTRIVEAVSGVGMPLALVKILLGEPVDISPRHTRGACYKFFGPPPGVFEAALDVEQAGRLPGILDFGFHLPPGTAVTPFSNGAERPGYAVAAGATRAEAIANADRAVAAVRFVMRPEGDPSVA